MIWESMSEYAFRLKDGRKMNTSNLKQAKPLFLLIAVLAFLLLALSYNY